MWFKVDDNFIAHWKVAKAAEVLAPGGADVQVRKATGRIVAVWLEAGLYASKYVTDGFVPTLVVRTFRTDPKALEVMEACAAAGLLDREADGYRYHDWDVYQLPAAPVKEKEATATRNKQLYRHPEVLAAVRARDVYRCRWCGRQVKFSDKSGGGGGTYAFLVDGPVTVDNVVVCCRDCRKGRESLDRDASRLLPPGTSEYQDGPKGGAKSGPSESSQLLLAEHVDDWLEVDSRVNSESTRSQPEVEPESGSHASAPARDPVLSCPEGRSTPDDPRALRARPARMQLHTVGQMRIHLRKAVHDLLEIPGRKFLHRDGQLNVQPLLVALADEARRLGVVEYHQDDLRGIIMGVSSTRNSRREVELVYQSFQRRKTRTDAARIKRALGPTYGVLPGVAPAVHDLCDLAGIQTYDIGAWFADVTLERPPDGLVTLVVPDPDVRGFLVRHYRERLDAAARALGGVGVAIVDGAPADSLARVVSS